MWVRATAQQVQLNAGAFSASFKDYYVNSSGYWLQYQNYFSYSSGNNGSLFWTAMSPMGTNELAIVGAFGYGTPYINTQPV